MERDYVVSQDRRRCSQAAAVTEACSETVARHPESPAIPPLKPLKKGRVSRLRTWASTFGATASGVTRLSKGHVRYNNSKRPRDSGRSRAANFDRLDFGVHQSLMHGKQATGSLG